MQLLKRMSPSRESEPRPACKSALLVIHKKFMSGQKAIATFCGPREGVTYHCSLSRESRRISG